MVMLNDLDRFHLVMDVIDRVPGLASQAGRAAPADGRQAARGAGLHARATARTCPRSATGPGRPQRRDRGSGPGRQRRVLDAQAAVVEATTRRSSGARTLETIAGGRGAAGPSPRRWPRWARCRPSVTASSTAASRSGAGRASTTASWPAAVPDDARAAPPAAVARRARRRAGRAAGRARTSPASTPRSTRRCRRPRRPTRSRGRGASAGRCGATGSTACRTPTPRVGPRSCWVCRSRVCGSSRATSAPAPRSRRSRAAGRSTRRWASRRSRAS